MSELSIDDDLVATIEALEETVAGLQASADTAGGSMDMMWILQSGFLVFFMQTGFGLLEVGSVRAKNMQNILFKNFMDACIGTMIFWFCGYGFAYGGGKSEDNGFIGADNFALEHEDGSNPSGDGYHNWFFQWAFAATASTIVSGSVAERTQLTAYFVYVLFISGFIYPVVVHWVWDAEGWLTAFKADTDDLVMGSGFIDFAGSGVVHTVGGFAGLVGAIVVGPRKGRFTGELDFQGQNIVLNGLGVFVLWFGWYGFNCGSTLAIYDAAPLASHVATTTTIGAAAGGLTCVVFARATTGIWNLGLLLNGILAGLVSITAPCPVVEPYAAFIIGIVGGFVYLGASQLLLKLKIDDPLDAWPVHGACGAWGCIAAGLCSSESLVAAAGYYDPAEVDGWRGKQFGIQFLGELAIIAWSVGTSLILFLGIKFTIGIRVDDDEQEKGLDISEHGGFAYSSVLSHEMKPSSSGEKLTAEMKQSSSAENLANIDTATLEEGQTDTAAEADA